MFAPVNLLPVSNKIQLHYWFTDKTHTMDALVHNKCERELLEITKAVASVCGVAIKMETEPSAKGGLKGWITLLPKSAKKLKSEQLTLVATLVTASVITPLHATLGNSAIQLIDKLLLDVPDQHKEQIRSEIDNLKTEVASKLPALDQSMLIKKRRSNFYDLLRKYQKVRAVSCMVVSDIKKVVSEDQLVSRDSFKNFILITDHLTPTVLEGVSIEIISPVLGVGKYKWKGMYNGTPISFNMKSNEFMQLVQTGKVEFKSGTTIHCTLEIEKKINSEGLEKITAYNIVRVASYLENGKSIETAEGKQHKQKQQISKRQLDLFG
jgi:hypothetical protein